MKENDNDKVKSLGYHLGQALAIAIVICLITLVLGATIAILRGLF